MPSAELAQEPASPVAVAAASPVVAVAASSATATPTAQKSVTASTTSVERRTMLPSRRASTRVSLHNGRVTAWSVGVTDVVISSVSPTNFAFHHKVHAQPSTTTAAQMLPGARAGLARCGAVLTRPAIWGGTAGRLARPVHWHGATSSSASRAPASFSTAAASASASASASGSAQQLDLNLGLDLIVSKSCAKVRHAPFLGLIWAFPFFRAARCADSLSLFSLSLGSSHPVTAVIALAGGSCDRDTVALPSLARSRELASAPRCRCRSVRRSNATSPRPRM